jgi:hypothetical protein
MKCTRRWRRSSGSWRFIKRDFSELRERERERESGDDQEQDQEQELLMGGS